MVATATNDMLETGADAFFGKDDFYVEELPAKSGSRAALSIWNGRGERTGRLEQLVSPVTLFWSLFFKNSLLPFHVRLVDRQGSPLASIRRGWTIMVSRTEILDARGAVIGFLKHKQRARKPRIKIFNASGKKIGEITGTKSPWDMSLIDRDYHTFGFIATNDEGVRGRENKSALHVTITREVLPPSDRRVMLVAALALQRVMPHA